MTALDELRADEARKVMARFFVRIGQVGRATQAVDQHTGQLFSLSDYLECEGLLSAELLYLRRCAQAIRRAVVEMAA